MKNSVTDQIVSCLKECIAKYNEHDVISPENLAICAINTLDPNHSAPPTIEWSCNLNLRQMARGLLRRTFDPVIKSENELSGQLEMFDGLQDRYPADRCDGHVYVPRMDLTLDERMINIQRMKKEVAEKQKHIDALMEETNYLMETGFFSITAN